MDRIDAMIAFVATVDSSGFASAARKLGRSPASITRAVAFLEERTGTPLLVRTTRAVKLTEAGERYLSACRRILAELDEAEHLADGEKAVARGTLTLTAPVTFGRLHVRPILDAFLDAQPQVQGRLLLLDRIVGLVDEGIDVGVRIAHMPDSALQAVKVGDVRWLVCASPDYLRRRGVPKRPSDLASHQCISFSHGGLVDSWPFAGGAGGATTRAKIHPRFTVNSADATIVSAVEGHGVTRVLSYQVRNELREGSLVLLLEPFRVPPMPVHIVRPAAGTPPARVRGFLDLAVPRLRAALESESTLKGKKKTSDAT